MRTNIIGTLAAAICTLAIPALAEEATWKDGVLFAEEQIASLEGHTAFKIVFGLEPGKCAGEFTAPDEWLKMTEGTLTFSYPGEGDVERSADEAWMATQGTKVTVCNKGEQNALLVGVQMRKK